MSPCLLHTRTCVHAHTHTPTHKHTHTHTHRYYRPFGVCAGSIEFPSNKKVAPVTAPYIIVSDQSEKAKDAKDGSKPTMRLNLSMKVYAWVRGGWEGGFFVGMARVGNEEDGFVQVVVLAKDPRDETMRFTLKFFAFKKDKLEEKPVETLDLDVKVANEEEEDEEEEEEEEEEWEEGEEEEEEEKEWEEGEEGEEEEEEEEKDRIGKEDHVLTLYVAPAHSRQLRFRVRDHVLSCRKARADVGLAATASDAELEQRKAELEAKRKARAEVGLPETATDAELWQRKAELEANAVSMESSWGIYSGSPSKGWGIYSSVYSWSPSGGWSDHTKDLQQLTDHVLTDHVELLPARICTHSESALFNASDIANILGL